MKLPARVWQVAGLAVALAAGSGCVALVAGAAAGGAVSYVHNELHATQPVSLERAWAAVKAATAEAGYRPVSEQRDSLNALWRGRNALDQPVHVELKRLAEKSTQIRIRVGVVTTSQNRAAAQWLYDQIRARL